MDTINYKRIIMKLISMTSFVLQRDITDIKQRDSIVKYANFLKQPLKLEMFVPIDQNGNILEEPKMIEKQLGFEEVEIDYDYAEVEVYKKAKEKVLFEGIEFRKNGGVNFLTIKEDTFAFFDFNVKFKNLTIEYLIQYDLQLIENAVKQIGI